MTEEKSKLTIDCDMVSIIEEFVKRVNERAERNMEKTGRLEGAYYAAMTSELKLMRSTQELGRQVPIVRD